MAGSMPPADSPTGIPECGETLGQNRQAAGVTRQRAGPACAALWTGGQDGREQKWLPLPPWPPTRRAGPREGPAPRWARGQCGAAAGEGRPGPPGPLPAAWQRWPLQNLSIYGEGSVSRLASHRWEHLGRPLHPRPRQSLRGRGAAEPRRSASWPAAGHAPIPPRTAWGRHAACCGCILAPVLSFWDQRPGALFAHIGRPGSQAPPQPKAHWGQLPRTPTLGAHRVQEAACSIMLLGCQSSGLCCCS